MKHLKQYENDKDMYTMPNVNDYIIAKVNDNRGVDTFLNTNIGQVISIRDKKIFVAYNNIPSNLENYFYYSDKRKTFYTEYIFGFTKFIYASSKEELEELLAQNKYNL